MNNTIDLPVAQLQARLDELPPDLRQAVEAAVAQKREMARKAAASTTTLTIPCDPVHRFDPFPLTDIQQAQWFGRSGLFDISVAGHGYVEFNCKGKDLDRLEGAFRKLIELNPQMRMVVLPGLQQKVLKDVPPYTFRRHDLRGRPQQEIDAELLGIRERMAHEILPADTWPIYEVCASQWDPDELRLHFHFDLLVGDAWCFRMIIDEWARLYDDPLAARRQPTELTYRDYVLGFETIEKSDSFATDLAYWRNELESLAPAPQLPMIRKISELQQIRPNSHKIRLDGAKWTALKQKIKLNKLTPSAFFAAAFSEVLSLWNHSPRHTLNVTVFNRLPVHPEIDDILVGEFNSFQLLNVDNSTGERFVDRAGRLQALMWQHLEHRWVTGVRLMRELAQIQGVGAGDTLMPVVFTSTIAHHEGESDIPAQSPGEWVYEVSQTPQVWMEHHLWEEPDGVSLHIDVVDGLFPENLIEDFVATYEGLVVRLIDDDAAWAAPHAAYLLPSHNRERWDAYNDTAKPRPQGLIHEAITDIARRFPGKIALHSARGSLTYAQLEHSSNQLAHWLQARGVQPDELVALIAPKGWEQVVGAVGIVKSGGAYLPIDHDQPPARVLEILADAGVRSLVTTGDVVGTVEWPAALTPLVLDESFLAEWPDTLPPNPATPGNLAYVIYTSGSTGKPKGCAIEHGAALNTIVDISSRFAVTNKDVLFAISSMGFDLSVYDVFGGLSAGATLVMPSTQLPNPVEWLSLCMTHGVTVWNSVPALAEMLVTHAEETGQLVPATLRLSMLSGDWIPLSLPPMLAAANPGMEVISLGGATEASIWSIYHPVKALSPEWSSVPYGRPLTNQTIHVLNAWLEPCPLWATGDIYIGGCGLAREYYHDKQRTDASFIVHPRTGERLYRTGDMGRLRPDGEVEFLGRIDTQVKVRGYRIELGEVEDALFKTGRVEHAVAITTGDTNQTRQLLAFVIPNEPAGDTQTFDAELTEALASRLPKYMIPSVFVHLDELPLTANGKVDRKKLASIGTDLRAKVEYVAPRNDTEERIAKLWQELLGVEKVGVHDDFFGLGGNSLIASRLLVKIHDIFEIEIPFAKLFNAANVAALSVIVIEQVLTEIEALEAAA